MRKLSTYFFSLLFLCFGCARKEFFQKSALVGPIEQERHARWDSATVVAGKHYDKGLFHRFVWGTHYRKVWAQPVILPVLDISRIHGGLTPEKMGGGFQTTSLTLENETGKQYALRSVDKDPQEVLPKGLRKTVLTNWLRDQTSAIHPYGAVVVSELAGGARIPHSHPKYVYIPKYEKGLGKNSSEFQDRVFLLEEKYEGKEALTSYLGKAKDLIDSEEFFKKRFTQHSHLPDQLSFAKARLFDVFIGDWDRHEGQWQWAVYDTSHVTTYTAVPKDRDQAFFKFDDGMMPWLFTRRWAPLKKMKTFHPKVSFTKGYLQNAQFIDARCLNEVTLDQWQQLAQQLQIQLTDSVLTAAVSALPTPVYAITGEEILRKLKTRREQLAHIAKDMYRHLSKHVVVAGTDQKEKFVVERLPTGDTRVYLIQIGDKGKKGDLLVFDRIFKKEDTKSIALYGLAEEDEFVITGQGDSGIKVLIYGGMGEDKVSDNSQVKGWGHKTLVLDTKQGVEVEKGKETKVKKKKSVAVHAFDREGL
ncbi:hypothetical protein ACD591_09760 [Rufibacter glacialis]|uniref:Uncharacterized protein n=1 Tax=Rufibacter glacialis TaxID=1259555 RepID=A0A5M8QA04_9BACT|nr:hypothetical protein [Rufibacter glacialis]KAA6431943.1 hypothetical protein FOE74_17705 [Rufibacter glacialis]GGK80212.1 hypothetical protein GCM10011405_29990 [Rufibacter glacialis]